MCQSPKCSRSRQQAPGLLDLLVSYLTLANILDETVAAPFWSAQQVAGPDRIDTGRSGALRPPMVGCGTTAQILGVVCLVLALALCPFTNKAVWELVLGEPEERRNPNESRLEAAVPGAPARDTDEPHNAGCDRRSLFSWLCLIPVGGLLVPGLYLTFFCQSASEASDDGFS